MLFRSNSHNLTVSFRSHLFLRAPRGLWACVNKECSGIENEYRYSSRNIGKLIDIPAVNCSSCGCRVLEVLYCFDCGDISLGGFVVDEFDSGSSTIISLGSLSSITSLKANSAPVFKRTNASYVWFWPNANTPVPNWTYPKKNSEIGRAHV